MKKYYIGLLILGLITLGLAGYVLSLGIQGKQDKVTYEKAQEIAEKLNKHTSTKRSAPESLEKVGITDVPGTIKYERLSTTSYKFCVTYKTDKGYGSGDITSAVTGAALMGAYGGGASMYDYEDSSYTPSYLYISYTYTKGENCQTVKLSSYGGSSIYEQDLDYDSGTGTGESSDDLYQLYCTTEEYKTLYADYCASLEAENSSIQTDEL